MPRTIVNVPLELWILIAEQLSLTELFNVSLTCRNIYMKIMGNDSLARYSLLRCAPSSLELHNAASDPDQRSGRFACALRRLMKRHMAIASARPFSQSTIATSAGEFIYRNGMLCYMDSRQQSLQMHNLHSPHAAVGRVASMNIRSALAQFPVDNILRLPNSTFRPLHYSHSIASWLCQFSGHDHSWVIVVNVPECRLIATWNVGFSIRDEYHVRNNSDFMCCIAREESSTRGRLVWTVQIFDLKRLRVLDGRIVLAELAGMSVDKTICFEIFDDYFYAVSGSVFYEGEAQNFTSFYHACRCRLGSHRIEQAPRAQLWRRQHQEGPVHDAFCELSLSKDDETGILNIHEVRVEWLKAGCLPTRTCYRTELRIPSSDPETATQRSTRVPCEREASSHVASENVDPMPSLRSSAAPMPLHRRRRPSHVHRGGYIKTTNDRMIPIRSYQPYLTSFIDVAPIYRREGPPGPEFAVDVQIRTMTKSLAVSEGMGGATRHFVNVATSQQSWANSEVDRIPPPESLRGNLVSFHNLGLMACCTHGSPADARYEGVVDERSLVLAVGVPGFEKRLTFVSFDPALIVPELQGL